MQETTLDFSKDAHSVFFELPESAYAATEISAAAYCFLDRCFVYLSRPEANVIGVRLTAGGSRAGDLDAIAAEFATALLAQRARRQLAQSSARIREYYTAAALRSAAAALSIDDLLAELDSEELMEDPLEISVPWEEKKDSGETKE